jgi:hypothetical protein
MQNLLRTIIAFAILASGTVLVPVINMPTESFQRQNYTEIYECTKNCLIVTSIKLDANPAKRGFSVVGMATVNDENGNPVPNASVSASWTLPNGIQYILRAETDCGGVATFQTKNRAGTYTLSINIVKKGGFTFDPDSDVLWNNLTTP